MLRRIEPCGVLIADSTVAGETRRDGVVPARPNGIRISRARWLLLYATRSFRGVDDDRSIFWQLRAASPVGRVVREGLFARSVDDRDPLGDGGILGLGAEEAFVHRGPRVVASLSSHRPDGDRSEAGRAQARAGLRFATWIRPPRRYR